MSFAPLSVTPCSSNWPASTTEGAIATAADGDDVDIEVNRDASDGVTLEVFAAAPIAPVIVGEDAGGDVDIPAKALDNEGVDDQGIGIAGVVGDIGADDVIQEGDAICEIVAPVVGFSGMVGAI